MDIYRSLGVRPVINAATTYTKLGGSIMAPEVVRAMSEAVNCFISLEELQNAVGRRLAELTHNEAAYVSCGAAAGLALVTAGCMTGDDPVLMDRLPDVSTLPKNEVVIHRAHRNWYDVAIRQTGAKLVEIGHLETFPWELDAALNERTACVFYFAGRHFEKTKILPLPLIIERAHARGIPVIVDAAAQLPPPENLWRFTTEMGADAVIFSGGKMLAGPQNTGLVVGRKEIVRAAQLNGPPVQRIGRSMKVSKEAMIGLLAAVEHYLGLDHEARGAAWSAIVDRWLNAWRPSAPQGIVIERLERGEAGEPIARIVVHFTPEATIDRDRFVELLRRDDPVIEVILNDATSISFSPHMLQPGEDAIVADRVRGLFAGLTAGAVVGAAAD